jgi:cystathionine beta-lyase
VSDPRFDDLDLVTLRRRRSAKWRRFSTEADVLPAWVAEMDFPLAEPVRAALADAVALGDTGYAHPGQVAEAFAGFARRRWAWNPDVERMMVLADVMTGALWAIELLTEPGDGVVIDVPAYPPFFAAVAQTRRTLVTNPVLDTGDGWRLNLDGLERAFAGGARAYLLCNPHNPTGHVATRAELTRIADLAARHDVRLIADEIHAPLALAGARHTPYASLDHPAASRAVTLASASKAWNLAGLKCALVVAGDDATWEALQAVPELTRIGPGLLGVLASAAAFTDGEEWLDACVEHLALQWGRLPGLLAEHLPAVRYRPGEAGYLAWLDCRELGLGDDPAAAFLERGRVALMPGPDFGEPGRGWARLNIATSGALLEEAVRRMARAVRA